MRWWAVLIPAERYSDERLVGADSLAAAHGHTIDRERGAELVAVAGTGLGARALVRRLPRRLPLLGALTGYLATRALGEAAIARFAADG